MIKYLAFEYQSLFSFLNIFSYITFRAGASILTGLFFSLIFGNYIINKLSNVQPTGQPIRDDGPESHIIAKKGTCLLYTSPSPRDRTRSRMPSSA